MAFSNLFYICLIIHSSAGDLPQFNDVWVLNITTTQWKWVNGDRGPLTATYASNIPTISFASHYDLASDTLWMFSGIDIGTAFC